MTREEIRLDAEGIVRTACNLQLNVGLSDANAAVEAKILVLVRATLEEAARAVCVGCDSTDKLFNDGVAWMHRDESPGYEGPYYRCVASKIHDLIAALDKEGDHE